MALLLEKTFHIPSGNARHRYGLFNGPWVFGLAQPSIESMERNASYPRQFGDRNVLAAKVKSNIRLAIVALFERSGPATIPRFVVPVVVATFKRQTSWSHAHISQKILERGQPAVANLDAPPAVSGVALVVRLCASLDHTFPRLPCWRTFPANGVTVGNCAKAKFAPETTTGFCTAGPQRRSAHVFLYATVAATPPARRAIASIIAAGEDDETVKPFTSEIDNPAHLESIAHG